MAYESFWNGGLDKATGIFLENPSFGSFIIGPQMEGSFLIDVLQQHLHLQRAAKNCHRSSSPTPTLDVMSAVQPWVAFQFRSGSVGDGGQQVGKKGQLFGGFFVSDDA